MSQLKFACAWQLPWHAAWHDTAEHIPGDPVQLAWQFVPHDWLHEAVHSLWFMSDAHCAEQWPWQSVSHEPWQLKLGAVQPPMQLLTQVALQLASMVPWQVPPHEASSDAAQVTSKLTGMQLPVHPPEVSSVQLSLPVRSMLPQADRYVAWAVAGKKATRAPSMKPATAAKNLGRGNMESLLPTIVSQGPPGVESGLSGM
jgi:hypothetical protein